MSRPTKATVDYFPHFTKHGKSMFILERKFGNDGYAVWFKTLEILGASDNHFIDCRNPEQWEYLLAKLCVDDNLALNIFKCLADIQCISKHLWQNKIIYSENFVRNVTDAYKRRKVQIPTKTLVYEINGIKNKVNVNINEVDADKKPQTKVNKTKLNKNKLNTDINLPTANCHFEDKTGEHFKSIKESCDTILALPRKGKFNPFQWVQKKVNQSGHPGAIEEVLRRSINLWEDIEKPYPYLDKAFNVVNGNYNEQEAIKIHEEFKRMKPSEIEGLTSGIFKSI